MKTLLRKIDYKYWNWWIAKDPDNKVYIYKNKPTKLENGYYEFQSPDEYESLNAFSNVFKILIAKEPIKVKELLNELFSNR